MRTQNTYLDYLISPITYLNLFQLYKANYSLRNKLINLVGTYKMCSFLMKHPCQYVHMKAS